MKMKVETFFDPAKDPKLKRIEAWRAAGHYPPVDYHRVTADNSAGSVADSGRTIRFAASLPALQSGRGVESRYTCDVLAFEWLPPTEDKNAAWNSLRKDICADGPPKQDGIAPKKRQVYYLLTDRDFSARGIRAMTVYGPRDAEFK